MTRARLLLISNKSYRKNINEVGDIVGVFEDTHIFSGTEQEMFDVQEIEGLTKAEIEERFDANKPEQQIAYKASSAEWSLDEPEQKDLWKNSKGEWCYLEELESYPFTTADMSTQAKATLADPEASKFSKLIIIDAEIKETTSRRAENLNKVDKLIENNQVITG